MIEFQDIVIVSYFMEGLLQAWLGVFKLGCDSDYLSITAYYVGFLGACARSALVETLLMPGKGTFLADLQVTE